MATRPNRAPHGSGHGEGAVARSTPSGPTEDEPILLLSNEPNKLRRDTGFQCVIKFRNELPEIPCDPKLLLPNVPASRLAAFALTSLERDLRCEPDLEPDLGLHFAPLDAASLDIPDEPAPLDPRDMALVASDDETHRTVVGGRSRAQSSPGELSWLLRTSYLTSGGGSALGRGQAAPTSGASTGGDPGARVSREERVAAIEASFEAAAQPPVHATKPELRPMEVHPLLPDDQMTDRQFVLALFDSDPVEDVPALAGTTPTERRRAKSSLQLKSFAQRRADGTVDRFVASLVKERAQTQEETAEGGEADEEIPAADLVGDYAWIREYDSSVRFDDRHSTYLFRLADDHVAYHDLNMKLALRKRTRVADEDADQFMQPDKVVLRLPGEYEDNEQESKD